MITKNFDAMMRTVTFGRLLPTGVTTYTQLTETHYLQDNNTVVKADYSPSYLLQTYASPRTGINTSFTTLVLGTQTSVDEVIAAESYYDYKLTHETSSIALSASEVTLYTENGTDYLRIHRTTTNTTQNTWLIREIGLLNSYVNMDSWSTNNGKLLFYRKVLPNYVEVVPNGTYTVDIKIPLTSIAPNKPSA